jgi:hypothetical protein
MIAPRNERRARRRAERRGMELRVTQTGRRDPVQRRRWDNAAEGARGAEANVVGHDEQHVGRAFGRHHARRPPRFRFSGILLDHAAEFRVGWRELFPAKGRGGAGRTRYPGSLLGVDRYRCHEKNKASGGHFEKTSSQIEVLQSVEVFSHGAIFFGVYRSIYLIKCPFRRQCRRKGFRFGFCTCKRYNRGKITVCYVLAIETNIPSFSDPSSPGRDLRVDCETRFYLPMQNAFEYPHPGP